MNFIQLLKQELQPLLSDGNNYLTILIGFVVFFILACLYEAHRVLEPAHRRGDLVAIHDSIGVYRVLISYSDTFSTYYKLQNVETLAERNLVCETRLKTLGEEHISYLNDRLSLLELTVERGRANSDTQLKVVRLSETLNEINKRGEINYER